MNKEEMMDKIAKMECEISYLKKELNKQEKPKKSRWKPEPGEVFFYLIGHGEILCSHWNACTIQRDRYALGNCFKTNEEAKFAVEQFKVISQLKEYADDDKEWNYSNSHWVIGYSTDKGCMKIHYYIYSIDVPFNIYFSSQEQAQKAIDAIGEGRLKKYYFCVEE